MANRKNRDEEWPKVIVGSHSTRTEYQDGRVDFVTDWDKLAKDVREAIADYERKKLVNDAPYHPGYESAVIKSKETKNVKVRKTSKSK